MTDRRLSDALIDPAAELLAAILDTTENLVVILDRDGRIVEFNRACEAVTGFDRAEVLGRPVWEAVVPAAERDDVRAYFERLRGGDDRTRFQNRWLAKDGSTRYLEWSNAVIRNGDGAVRFVIGTGIDVSELAMARQDAEVDEAQLDEARAQLATTERRFEMLVENMSDGFAVDDPDGRLTFVNPALCEMLQRGRGELIGEPLSDHLDALSREKLWEKTAARSLDPSIGTEAYELTFIRADGSTVETLVSPQRLTGPDGEYLGSFAVLTDISRIKSMERTQALLSTAIEQAAESVVITDPDGTILYVNPAFERTTGYSAAEAVGANPRFLKSGEQDEEFYREMWRTITAGKVWQGHFTNLRRDGTTFDEEATISPVRGKTGAIEAFVAVKRDVSYERVLTDQLNRAQRLEALGELAGGIAHDFNNLLTQIAGSIELLRLELPEGSQAVEEIRSVGDAIARGSELTRHLLSAAHRQVLQMEVVDLDSAIREELALIGRMLPDAVSIEYRPAERPLHIVGDRGQLNQVLLNLCLNARDAMPDGGRVTITAAETAVDALFLAAHPEIGEGRYAKISVADTGVGMAPEILDRIFDPFFTTKRDAGGAGLGLATVYGIMRQHRGVVEVRSRPNAGTVFELYFPLTSEKPDDPDSRPELPAVAGGERVLVVEDEERVRRTLVRMLDALGYHVLEAANGRLAVELLSDPEVEVDVVLSDVSMPEMGGQELYDRVRELRPGTAFVFTSGYTGADFLDRFRDVGATFFLPKPHSMADLSAIIRKALAAACPDGS